MSNLVVEPWSAFPACLVSNIVACSFRRALAVACSVVHLSEPTADVAMPVGVKVILDTDMGGGGCMDVDDVTTLCMLHALADLGECELLAVLINTMPGEATGAVSVINHYYGRDATPIGAFKGDNGAWSMHSYVGAPRGGSNTPLVLRHQSSPRSSVSRPPRVRAAACSTARRPLAVSCQGQVAGAGRDGALPAHPRGAG